MCKPGDIIVVRNYISNDGVKLTRHSFVVLSNEKGNIKGMDFDLVASVMSSFKNAQHKQRKLSFIENFYITVDDYNDIKGNDKDGYIKAEQLYFFQKNQIDYIKIGKMNSDCFQKLLDLIQLLDKNNKLVYVINNL